MRSRGLKRRVALLGLLLLGCGQSEKAPVAEAATGVEPGPSAITREEADRQLAASGGPRLEIEPNFPDPYEAPALGVKLQKPAEWVYLAETSHPDPLRWSERQRFDSLREIIADRKKPLVSMSPSADATPGVDPIVYVVFRLAYEPPFVQEEYQADPTIVAGAYTHRFTKLPDHRVIEPTELTTFGGLPGAVTQVGYSLQDPDTGEKKAVTSRVWNTKRDFAYVYVETLMPDPPPPGAEARAEEIVASLTIDPPRMPPFSELFALPEDERELW